MITMIIPKRENKANEYRRSNEEEIKPITGGPSRKPKKAMEETKVSAIPA